VSRLVSCQQGSVNRESRQPIEYATAVNGSVVNADSGFQLGSRSGVEARLCLQPDEDMYTAIDDYNALPDFENADKSLESPDTSL